MVKTLGWDDSVDLARVLQPLISEIPCPTIHLNVPEDLQVQDPARAHALVRCVQEIITNAVKHSSADNLWIEFHKTSEGLEARAHDDDQAVKGFNPGQGLRGMRKRLEELGGQLEAGPSDAGGFRLKAWLPLPEGQL